MRRGRSSCCDRLRAIEAKLRLLPSSPCRKRAGGRLFVVGSVVEEKSVCRSSTAAVEEEEEDDDEKGDVVPLILVVVVVVVVVVLVEKSRLDCRSCAGTCCNDAGLVLLETTVDAARLWQVVGGGPLTRKALAKNMLGVVRNVLVPPRIQTTAVQRSARRCRVLLGPFTLKEEDVLSCGKGPTRWRDEEEKDAICTLVCFLD